MVIDIENLQHEVTVTTEISSLETPSEPFQDKLVQTEKNAGISMPPPILSSSIKENEEGFDYLTGFENYDHCMMLFQALGPVVHALKNHSRCLTPENELFLTLV